MASPRVSGPAGCNDNIAHNIEVIFLPSLFKDAQEGVASLRRSEDVTLPKTVEANAAEVSRILMAAKSCRHVVSVSGGRFWWITIEVAADSEAGGPHPSKQPPTPITGWPIFCRSWAKGGISRSDRSCHQLSRRLVVAKVVCYRKRYPTLSDKARKNGPRGLISRIS